MKKILILSLLYLFCTQYGVAETKKGEKKSLTLGQQRQQSYQETGREMQAKTKIDCSEHSEMIMRQEQMFYYDTATDIDQKRLRLQMLGSSSCPDVISFYENIITNDTSEICRFDAIRCLGWIDAQSSIPVLLKRAGNDGISSYEKTCIGTTLAVLEDWSNAEKILNANCFNTEIAFCNKCIWAYYMLGNESSKKYYRYIIKNSTSSGTLSQCAQRLADLGDEKISLPIFEKILNTETEEYIRKGALSGLESLDSRRSLKVIQKYQTDVDPAIQKYVKEILKERDVRLQNELFLLKTK